MVRFAMDKERGDEGVGQLWRNVVEQFQRRRGQGTANAIDALEQSYYDKRDQLRAYFRFLTNR